MYFFFFFFKKKTAYEIVSGDWSSDVCSSDLLAGEMILSFYKGGTGAPACRQQPYQLTIDQLVAETLAEVSPDGRPFAGELLFNRIILKAWRSSALQSLDVSREDLAEALTRKGWRYNAARHQ